MVEEGVLLMGADGVQITELLPCPLCGADAEWVTTHGIRSPWSMVRLDALGTSVQCMECGCTIPAKMSLDEARDAWNRRVDR